MSGDAVNATKRSGRRRNPAGFGTAVLLGAVLGTVLAALPGCVTINIYFPAAAAEKAADKIIDEVWQLDQKRGGANDKPATN
jgi:hypothetical protein